MLASKGFVLRVVVSAASKHGSTAQIATRIGEALRAGLPDGAVVQVTLAAQAGDMAAYDAIVLGSAVYMGRWLREGPRSRRRHRHESGAAGVVIFQRPVGDPPKPDKEPSDVSDLMTSTGARGHQLFAGRIDRPVAQAV